MQSSKRKDAAGKRCTDERICQENRCRIQRPAAKGRLHRRKLQVAECGDEKDSPSAGRRNVQYQERGKERVSEKEKEILETMAEALPKMDDMKKANY